MSQSLINLSSIMALAALLSISTHQRLLATSQPSAAEERRLIEARSEKENEEEEKVGPKSFREYYRWHKFLVDKRVTSGHLWLSGLQLTDLIDFDKEHVPGLNKIVALHLSDNLLTTLDPNVFRGMNRLTNIDLHGNKLTVLPDDIFEGLGALKQIDLNGNKLATLSPGIFNGLPLNFLDLSKNLFVTLPANIFEGLIALRGLNLQDNQLTTLPDIIFHALGALERLDLSGNKLAALPAIIFHGLKALGKVDLSYNKLTAIPGNIFRDSTDLRVIDLSNNQLASLPENIFNGLLELHWVDLSDNQITTLPANIFKGHKLDVLNLYNNPISGSEEELRQKYRLGFQHFWFKTSREEAVERLLIKAIQDGDANKVQQQFKVIIKGGYKPTSDMMHEPRHKFKKPNISKIRDANGNNLFQLIVKTLADKVKGMSAEVAKIMADKDMTEEVKKSLVAAIDQRKQVAEDLYTRIFMILTQLLLTQEKVGPKEVQEMLLTRDKNGYDVVGSAVGALGKDSTFVRALISFEHQPATPAKRFPIKSRSKTAETETEEVKKELAVQRERLAPSSALSLIK